MSEERSRRGDGGGNGTPRDAAGAEGTAEGDSGLSGIYGTSTLRGATAARGTAT